MTVGEALTNATRSLEEHRIESALMTAEVLLAHCMETERPFLYAHADKLLSNQTNRRYQSMIARRLAGEPLQYITGLQEFFGRSFSVDPSVLIPRPETEFVIDAVLEINTRPAPRIVDVGTGSGCIACVLALELPGASVFASDISLEALATARKNADRLHASIHFACVNSLDAWSGPFDIIVSNPPYVTDKEHDGLQREVRDFEPRVALVGNGNPLDLYRLLCAQSCERLIEGGALVVEIGYSMEEAVRSLFGRGWELMPTESDLRGIPRVIAARRR